VPTTGPDAGDQNPYGIAFVPPHFAAGGPLNPGDILVSNFNNAANVQGTGRTIVRVTPNGQTSVFFQAPASITNVGLTTALGVLQRGFMLVGSVPTTDGTAATIMDGSLMIIDRNGKLVENLTDSALLQGPWDLTINDEGDHAEVFVSNVLSGTVTRIDLVIPPHSNPIVESETQIASGYLHRSDPSAVVIGPTGLAYDAEHDILYVASTGDNAIFAIHDAKDRVTDAGMGHLVYRDNARLHGPLGLVLAPNGDLITANGDAVNADPNHPSEIVEFTVTGHFVGQISIHPNVDAAFGIALQFAAPDSEVRFAAVDDNTNTVHVWTIDLDGTSGSDHGGSRVLGTRRSSEQGGSRLRGTRPGGAAVNAAVFAVLARDHGEDHGQVVADLVAARVELLKARQQDDSTAGPSAVLAHGLHVVPSLQVSKSGRSGTTAIADNDLWALAL
jgi:hypothetical protein